MLAAMTNHFHLLFQVPREHTLSKTMHSTASPAGESNAVSHDAASP